MRYHKISLLAVAWYVIIVTQDMAITDTDKNIIEDCVSGQKGAWGKFVQHFSGLIIWSIKSRLLKFGLTFTKDDVEDIHQEVFLCIYKDNSLNRLKDISKAASWLSILAGNIAITYIRQNGCVVNKSVSLFEEIAQNQDCALMIADKLQSENPLPAENIDKNIQEETLANIMECLQPREKLILSLYYVYDNTINEIARNLAIPQGSVASILARVKDKIRIDFQQKGLM